MACYCCFDWVTVRVINVERQEEREDNSNRVNLPYGPYFQGTVIPLEMAPSFTMDNVTTWIERIMPTEQNLHHRIACTSVYMGN